MLWTFDKKRPDIKRSPFVSGPDNPPTHTTRAAGLFHIKHNTVHAGAIGAPIRTSPEPVVGRHRRRRHRSRRKCCHTKQAPRRADRQHCGIVLRVLKVKVGEQSESPEMQELRRSSRRCGSAWRAPKLQRRRRSDRGPARRRRKTRWPTSAGWPAL